MLDNILDVKVLDNIYSHVFSEQVSFKTALFITVRAFHFLPDLTKMYFSFFSPLSCSLNTSYIFYELIKINK